MPRSGRSRDNVDEEELDSTFARAKAEGEALGLKGVELVNYIKEQRQAEAEAEQRRFQAEVEERQVEREFELQRLRIQMDGDTTENAANPSRSSSGHQQELKIKLPYFENRDDLEAYLRKFERSAKGQRVAAQRDTAAQSDLVPERCKTGKTVEVTLASSSEKRTFPIAMVTLDTPYFHGPTEVLLMEEPVHKVLIGNYRIEADGTVSSIPVYPVRKVGAATLTRPYGRKTDEPSTPPQALLGSITLEEMGRAQRADPTLARIPKLAEGGSTRQEGESRATKPEAIYRCRKGIL
ncbi:hypothetical protein C0Q70_04202 [Pomacea canaliculata]|uniref:Uncharacterized protein n=1 Tax=Pomacea canaliculata TaxID=400727 RepID=A0A2T7PV00_POMCA|nr:hypothetical protein C0Q70_04202 [Pomacea canaliculata]